MRLPAMPDIPEPVRGQWFAVADAVHLGSPAGQPNSYGRCGLWRRSGTPSPPCRSRISAGCIPILGGWREPWARASCLRACPREAVVRLLRVAGPDTLSLLTTVELRHISGQIRVRGRVTGPSPRSRASTRCSPRAGRRHRQRPRASLSASGVPPHPRYRPPGLAASDGPGTAPGGCPATQLIVPPTSVEGRAMARHDRLKISHPRSLSALPHPILAHRFSSGPPPLRTADGHDQDERHASAWLCQPVLMPAPRFVSPAGPASDRIVHLRVVRGPGETHQPPITTKPSVLVWNRTPNNKSRR